MPKIKVIRPMKHISPKRAQILLDYSSPLPKIANCGEVCASQLVPLRHKLREDKQPFSENRVQIDPFVWLEFCSMTDTQTDRQAHTHTHKLQCKYNPSTISLRCKKKLSLNCE